MLLSDKFKRWREEPEYTLLFLPIIAGAIIHLFVSLFQIPASPADYLARLWDTFREKITNGIAITLVIFLIQLYREIKKTFTKIDENTANSFYRGFFALLSKEDFQREGLQDLEKTIGKAVGFDFVGRGIIFNFLIETISKMGKSGFAMVDASVMDYVKYIKETLRSPELNVSATCVVRPHWFLVDEIADAILAPFYEGEKTGKAEHLLYFSAKEKKGSVAYQRILVVDEAMAAEMILSTYIDRNLYEMHSNNSKCPICDRFENGCPIQRREIVRTIDDIPEIYWFKSNVNRDQKVSLLYTFVPNVAKHHVPELEDRVFISKPPHLTGTVLDIQFQFMNLEKGILRINWGKDRTIELPYIDAAHPTIAKQINNHHHMFYKTFADMLKSSKIKTKETDAKKRMIDHLNMLQGLVEQYFGVNEILAIKVTIGDPQIIKKLLNDGKNDFKDVVISAIKTLKQDMDLQQASPKSVADIYDGALKAYQKNGVSPVAYIVTYDKGHPEYPVRVAQWSKNWKGLLQNARKP